MENNNEEIVIDLREVFSILKKKVKTVFAITLAFMVVAGAYAFFWPKTYESVAIVITAQDNQNYFTARKAVEPVIAKYGERNDKGELPKYKDFVKTIKLTQPRNSKFLTVTVQAKEPKLAQDINKMLLTQAQQLLIKVRCDNVDKRIAQTEKDVELVREQIADVETDMKKLSNVASDTSTKSMLAAKVATYYDKVFAYNEKIADLRLERINVTNELNVVDEPSFDEKPVAPRKARTLAIALVLGLIFGSMYAVIKEKM